METTVKKWGNSLAIRVPKKVAEECKMYDGSKVSISHDGKGMYVNVIDKADELKALLSEITPDNIHAEISFEEKIGREVW